MMTWTKITKIIPTLVANFEANENSKNNRGIPT
jgi:hypothetical protein